MKGISDVIFNYIVPSQVDKVVPIEVNYFDMCMRNINCIQARTFEAIKEENAIMESLIVGGSRYGKRRNRI